MKRKVFVLTLNLALLLSIVAVIPVVEVAEANPVALSWLPTSPDASQPTMAVQSPSQDQYYNSHSATLNFTVTKPESWFGNETFYGNTQPASYYCNGKIVSVQYMLDGKPHNVSVNDDSVLSPYGSPLKRNLVFSENVSLSQGKHVLSVHVSALAYYMPSDNWNVNSHGGVVACESNEIAVGSDEITFYVADESNPVTFVAASVAALAVISVGLFYYQKKRHQGFLTKKVKSDNRNRSGAE
jgi:hypothetical protein